MITRTWALLPSIAAVVFGTDEISVGSPIGTPPTVIVWIRMLGLIAPVKSLAAIRFGNRFAPRRVPGNVMATARVFTGPRVTATLPAPGSVQSAVGPARPWRCRESAGVVPTGSGARWSG